MSCCGQKRRTLNSEASESIGKQSLPPNVTNVQLSGSSYSASPLRPSILVRHTGSEPINVTGQITGKSYSFVSSQQILSVDALDAALLTRMKIFRRV